MALVGERIYVKYIFLYIYSIHRGDSGVLAIEDGLK